VERKGVDPFEVDVIDALQIIKKYLPGWELIPDLCLDAEALNKLSTVIKLQGDWLKYRSSPQFINPLLIELKLKTMDVKRLVEIFLQSWHPIVGLQQLSFGRIKEAVDYWNQLLPLEERWKKYPSPTPSKPGYASINDLTRLRLLSEEAFNEVLQQFWQELARQTGTAVKIPYWKFIYADTYEDTVLRAYLTSFLITYGYATLEIKPLEEEIFLIPNPKPKALAGKQAISVPISVDYQSWKEMRKARKVE